MNYLKRHGLGDYFNNIISLIPKVLKSSWVPALAVFLPAGIAYALGFSALGTSFTHIEEWINDPESIIFNVLRSMGGFLWFMVAGLLLTAGQTLLNAIVSQKSFSIINGEEPPAQPVRSAMKGPFWTLLLQSVILSAIVMAFTSIVSGGAVLVGILAALGNSAEGSNEKLIMLTVFLACMGIFFLILPAIYWFTVKTLLAPQAVIRERCGPFAGIQRSFTLVKGNFWRTLGIYLLISMVLSFAVSMISGPLVFIMIMPGYIEFISSMMSAGDSYSSENAFRIFGMFKSMAVGMGITVVLQSAITYIVFPIFGCLLYTDLSIRKGELAEFVPEAAGGDAGSPQATESVTGA